MPFGHRAAGVPESAISERRFSGELELTEQLAERARTRQSGQCRPGGHQWLHRLSSPKRISEQLIDSAESRSPASSAERGLQQSPVKRIRLEQRIKQRLKQPRTQCWQTAQLDDALIEQLKQ